MNFDAVILTDGARVRIESAPVEVLAPAPRSHKSRKKGLAGAWAQVTASVGEIVREAKGEGRTPGRVSGAHSVRGDTGVDVEVPAGSTVDVELMRPVTVTPLRAP